MSSSGSEPLPTPTRAEGGPLRALGFDESVKQLADRARALVVNGG